MRACGTGRGQRTPSSRRWCPAGRTGWCFWRHPGWRDLVGISGAPAQGSAARTCGAVQACGHDAPAPATARATARVTDARHSIQSAVTLEGIGLHLGRTCRLTFRPADGGTGIVFRRMDLDGQPEIPARIEHAVLSERRTQLGDGEAGLHTVEHVLAAVAAHRIDDLVIEMDGPEPPILDGSARPYFEALRCARIADRPGTVQYLALRRPVTLVEGESQYEV